jgi:hypothetical protein
VQLWHGRPRPWWASRWAWGSLLELSRDGGHGGIRWGIAVIPAPIVPAWILLAVPAAILLGNVIAALPGRSAARTRSAAILRVE